VSLYALFNYRLQPQELVRIA